MLRRTFFWLHLVAGVAAGAVILLMSITGVVLAFEKQIVAYAERGLRASDAEAAGTALPLSQIVANAMRAADAEPTNVLVRADKHAPVTVAFGREKTLFVNPYTGAVLGQGATTLRHFFEINEQLHRWLAMKGEGRTRGKAITGVANVMFLFIVLSGLVIWLPRRFTRASFRNATLFRRGSRGRARDFNWHHVFGIWAFVPLVAIVASAISISYPSGGGARRPGNERAKSSLDLAAFDRLASAAKNEATRLAPQWKSMSIRLPLPNKGPATISLDQGNGARPDKRSQLMLDPRTARFVEHKTYAQQETEQKTRSWMRWIHTGEAGGLFGQLIAMLASAAAVMLVYTGIALAVRRFARALRGTPVPPQQLLEEEGNA